MENLNWLEKTKELRSQGSFEKTIGHLEQVLKQQPNDPVVYYQIAWTHDALGKESEAAPAYEKAIELGLAGEDLEGAYLGLVSTYRCLGDYANSKRVFEKGIFLFPENGAMKIFYAMTLYNLKYHSRSMEILIKELVQSSNDPSIQKYRRALLNYSDKLDQTFE